MALREDDTLANAEVFVSAGIRRIMLQNQTRQRGPASAETIAMTAALGRALQLAHPTVSLGITVEAHDAVAPIAIAHASAAGFVRLKVFVGAARTVEGRKEALAIDALTDRHQLRPWRRSVRARKGRCRTDGTRQSGDRPEGVPPGERTSRRGGTSVLQERPERTAQR